MDLHRFNSFKIYRTLKNRVPAISYMAKVVRYCVFRPQKKSYGDDNPDKTFYVIGVYQASNGLFAIANSILRHCIYAESKGYIPVVDLQNHKSQYSDEYEDNVWEYFFEQPGGYTLEDISKSKNIILSRPFSNPTFTWNEELSLEDEHFEDKRKKYAKYIRPSRSIKEFLDSEYNRIVADKKILGLLCRGTDYTMRKPSKHSIQPAIKDVIPKAHEVMGKYGCEFIYLATEDADIKAQIQAEFKDRLLTNNQRLYSAKDLEGQDFLSEVQEDSKLAVGKQYMLSVYILSKASCLVAGNVGGTWGACLLSEGFEYSYVWKLGKYK